MPILRHGYSNNRAERRAQYGSKEHRWLRANIAMLINNSEVFCSRCDERILPGTFWDLDHTDDRTGYLGPSHASCNRGRK